jgi:Protein of unknown function (DUF3102)
MTTLASLGEPDLIKKANEEYSAILQHDRMDYPHAITIGEVLNELKRRKVVPHGEWQSYLKSRCPKISYETAIRYMRIAKPDNQSKIVRAVEDKSVAATDLTIAWAEQFLAKPRQAKPQKETKQQQLPSKSATSLGGVMPSGGVGGGASDFEAALKNWASDELFPKLRDTWEMNELQKLHALLGQHIATLKQAA